jgi:hypothetical protein
VRPLPEPIQAYLRELLHIRWSGRDVEPPLDALPRAMPEGVVQKLCGGGPFGWMIHARLDEIDGRLALEALEDDRMSGPDHYRVWEDGTVEKLPNEHTGYGHAKDATADEIERIKEAFFAHNRAVQAQLRERGFMQ